MVIKRIGQDAVGQDAISGAQYMLRKHFLGTGDIATFQDLNQIIMRGNV